MATTLNSKEYDTQVIITQQTIYDLSAWLSAQHHSHEQLKRLQSEVYYLPLVALANEYWLIGALTNKLKEDSVWSLTPLKLQEYLTELEHYYYQRSEAIQKETIFSCKQLLDANITPLVMKGAANLFNGVATPISTRYMSDIDLLVIEQKLESSVKALKEKGYFSPKDDDEILVEADAHHHATPIIRTGAICYLELHRWALPLSSHPILETSEIWEAAISLELDSGLQILQMHPTHQIVLAIVHSEISDSAYADKHINLRQLFNLYSLAIYFEDEINWFTVKEHFQRANLLHVLTAIMFSIHELFDLVTPLTEIDCKASQEHFFEGLRKQIKTQGNPPRFNYLITVFSGYRKQKIIDFYGENGKHPVLLGRIKHLKRHLRLLIAPKFLKRFIKRNLSNGE